MKLEIVDQLLIRWRELMPRERLLIAGGGVLLLVVIVYAALWLPLRHDLARMRASVPLERGQLDLMRQQAQLVQRLRSSRTRGASSGNLLTLVEQTSVSQGLKQAITRLEQDGSNGVRVSLDEVDFNALLSWLDHLQKQGARVENATLDARPTAGVVNARLLLRGAGK